MKRKSGRSLSRRALVVLTVGGLSALAFGTWTRFSAPQGDVNLLSEAVLEELVLRSDEIPAGYHLVADTNMMARLRMRANPDYVGAPSELESVARFGGQGSFVAIYGNDGEVRLLLNGIFFRAGGDCDRFIAFQRSKHRLVHGFRKDADDGFWLLLAARAPDLEYSAREARELGDGLARYASRLGLTPCMEPPADPKE
jgi:hypothetical protein